MKTLVEAVNEALHEELARDPSVFVMGEDVGVLGGVFRATAGLRERFPDRCPRPASSGPRSAWRSPAGARSARSSSTPSAIRRSTR